MGLSFLLVALLVAVGGGAWFLFSKGVDEATDGDQGAPETPGSFRCKLCGATSRTFVTAHEHASAEHELTGHKIDESIEAG
jgi:hypothetical protein